MELAEQAGLRETQPSPTPESEASPSGNLQREPSPQLSLGEHAEAPQPSVQLVSEGAPSVSAPLRGGRWQGDVRDRSCKEFAGCEADSSSTCRVRWGF